MLQVGELVAEAAPPAGKVVVGTTGLDCPMLTSAGKAYYLQALIKRI